jgi:hypothetical protein
MEKPSGKAFPPLGPNLAQLPLAAILYWHPRRGGRSRLSSERFIQPRMVPMGPLFLMTCDHVFSLILRLFYDCTPLALSVRYVLRFFFRPGLV